MGHTLVVIPARMQSTRLPGKPLADIDGEPMIVHVWRRAMEADVGRVVVATDSEEIEAVIAGPGGEAVMTRPDHPSGSDRVFEAVSKVDRGDFEVILNLQGDLPALEPEHWRATASRRCSKPAPISPPSPRRSPTGGGAHQPERRQGGGHADGGAGPAAGALLHARHRARGRGSALPSLRHVRLSPLARSSGSCRCRPRPLEKREQLEQLRALEDGMRIDVDAR